MFQNQDWGYVGVFFSTDSWLMWSSSASGTKNTIGKIVTSTYQCIFLFSQKRFSYFQQLPIYQLSTWNLLPSFWFSCLYSSSVQWLSHVRLFAMNFSMPGFPVHHPLLELAQTHVHWVSDAIQLSHPLLSSSPPAFNLSQHQGLFQWVSSLH